MQKVLYSYEGEMNNAIINSIINVMELKMKEMGERPPAIKKLNQILIECCQNLIHHSEKPHNGAINEYPAVIISQIDDGIHIQTRNLVAREKAERLKTYIDKINTMSQEGLREYYQSVLTNGQISAHGGGGLGLLNIIRKAKDTKLHYTFDPANDEELYFNLSFII